MFQADFRKKSSSPLISNPLKMTKKRGVFWSLDEVVGDLRIHVRPSVCAYVRTYVTLLLENRSLLFSETLQLVRACKCEKNVPSAFLKKIPVLPILSKIGHFGPKCQKMEVFPICFAICSLEFANFLY